MIQIQDDQILVDGQPRVVMAGEVHYFRVARDEWEQRILLLKEAGCNAVASYIPWLWHELPDGSIDVTGATRPERDVAVFIDLCAQHGLWFIARPGPFIMAELKNEGLPFRLYTEHAEIVPTGWDGRPAPSRTVDYLAPAYLAECERWFGAILPIIADRLQPHGGNVIAVQLDNEIGMLAWVTNSPDLTDHLVDDFLGWAQASRAGTVPYPLTPEAIRSPKEEWAGPIRQDLAVFMRDRFRRYVEALRAMAEAQGVVDVPFLINIHGTEGGSGEPFPIGISQLVETYAAVPGMLGGSDHYMGDMTLNTTTDLYVINAFMAAVNGPGQPTTSLEFEAGSGDYGGGVDNQYDPSTVELKTRRSLAQGNRMINYYLFAGGINPPLEEAVGDGNDRISFTGERHGTAAPVGPEGQKGMTYAATARTVHAVRLHERWLSRMVEDHDDVQLGLVLDSYATEYHHPDSAVMTEVVDDLVRHRGAGPRRALVRSMLLGGYRFGAVHLQRDEPTGVVALATGRHLSPEVQQGLVDHLTRGGGLLLLGRLPDRDLEGRPCTVLADALGVSGAELTWARDHYYPSVVASGWAAPWPETRVGWFQALEHERGDAVLHDVDGAVCGVDVEVGTGRAVLIAAELPSDVALFGRALRRLGVSPGLELSAEVPGIFATTTSTPDGERMLHLTNITGHHNPVRLSLDGRPIGADEPLVVPPRTSAFLALGLDTPVGRVEWANAELTAIADDALEFGPPLGDGTTVVLHGAPDVGVEGGLVQRDGERQTVTAPPGRTVRITPA
ncbi:beta-galactosidase [Pedococcus dokdonensis]|uniref:Beta-galactosidase n=1 Tax=Pedococcus dokdonensis TaxID=443156 RepID=A0A1H0SLA5_9MICO|nr:beta-galactosidase [Pedococcus dokdonensis]SDP41926.1 beta-galactosidase [Pedococcus dokdonensis]